MLAVGVRNSIDKSLPAGLAVGDRVLVCDYLMLAAEIVVMRKCEGRLKKVALGRARQAGGEPVKDVVWRQSDAQVTRDAPSGAAAGDTQEQRQSSKES